MGRSILIMHSGYGCETGCCGHYIEIDGEEGHFMFAHPSGQDRFEWAKQIVADELGEEHVADLDFENCHIVDD